nr:orotidine-5'-phosphate decarboxylase [Microbacterium immunditiarum]
MRTALDTYGPLCVGIDPHISLVEEWGLDASAAGICEFGLRVVEAASGRVGVVKPQVAFFERFGSAGFAALEDVLGAARDAGLVVIADAKRGDIGSTMDGYAAAWLSAGSPLEADAVTLNPFLGADSLRDTLASALAAGKGAFVLAATSNPEAHVLQGARVADGADETVAARVARDAAAAGGASGEALGSIGVVVGATADRAAVGLTDAALEGLPILAPGFGAQGAEPNDLRRLFGRFCGNVVASESRSILSAGPDRLAARIEERAGLYAEVNRD